MAFWKKEDPQDGREARAERIIQKKRRKQDRSATGLGAVAIMRSGPRAVHQRNEDRHVLRGMSAHAEIDGSIVDVQLLNLSSNGVMIACEQDLSIGAEIRLTIGHCDPIPTAVRWVRAGRVGLEFIAETVIIAEAGLRDFILKTVRKEHEAATYTPKLEFGAERRGSATRHRLIWVARLKWGETSDATARLRCISRGGAMVSLARPTNLAEGHEVILALGNAGEIGGKIRWHSSHEYGIEFSEEFDVSLLVNENCAELAPVENSDGLRGLREEVAQADADLDSLNVRLGNVRNPHQPPEMEYARLTLDEIYATLYPNGRPGEQG